MRPSVVPQAVMVPVSPPGMGVVMVVAGRRVMRPGLGSAQPEASKRQQTRQHHGEYEPYSLLASQSCGHLALRVSVTAETPILKAPKSCAT